jgi:hypothetical protein
LADSVRHAVRIRVPSDVLFVPGPQPWPPAAEEIGLTALDLGTDSIGRASDPNLYVVSPADGSGCSLVKANHEAIEPANLTHIQQEPNRALHA